MWRKGLSALSTREACGHRTEVEEAAAWAVELMRELEEKLGS